MLGLIAALNSLISKEREGREALIHENFIRNGQGLSTNKIYRESSVDRRARKELAASRYKERLHQQVKFVRLMKKLLIKANQSEEIDEEFEEMRQKVAQLEFKVRKDMNCEDMLDLTRPDDAYDIELEEFIRTTASSTKLNDDEKANGDYVYIRKSSSINKIDPYDCGDQNVIKTIDEKK
jgi:hypothetical protein